MASGGGEPCGDEGVLAGGQRGGVVEETERRRVVSDRARDRVQRRAEQLRRARAAEMRRQRRTLVAAEETGDAARLVGLRRTTVLANTSPTDFTSRYTSHLLPNAVVTIRYEMLF